LELDQSPTPVRHLTVRQRKQAWVAAAVAAICALVGWILAWRTTQILSSVGEIIVIFGLTWAVLTLAELRNRKGNAQGNGTKQA
jgi:hypothetical protein